MYDLFISYAREDRKRIKRLVDVLVEERGWSIWFDEALRAGDEYPRVIERALEQVRCVLVVWSKDAVASRWVIAEASEGWNRGILVPLRLDDSEPPLPFRQTEASDFSDWKGAARAPQVLKLLESIDRALQTASRPGESELIARDSRRRAHRQRKLIKRAVAGAGAAALLVGGWFGWQLLDDRAAADRIADRAAELQAEVRERNADELKRTWGSVLFESRQRLGKLEVATLVAAEAVRRARTDRTQQVLENVVAMSPWADWTIELKNEVHSLQFSADGTLLVAGGGEDGTLIWNRASNAVVTIPHGGTPAGSWQDRRGRLGYRGGPTIDVEGSGAGVATGGPDQTAALWDAQSGRELLRLAHESIVTGVAFVPRSDTLATVSENGIVRVWNLASGQELWRMQQDGTSYFIAASDSGRYLVSTSGRMASIWDSGKGAEIARLEHSGPVLAARFNADETLIVTFGDDIEMTVWDLPGGAVRKRIPVSAGERAGALFGPDGRTLIIGSIDGLLRWWRLDQDEEQFSVTAGYVLELASSADGERFVVADNIEKMASTWDFATGRQLRQMPYWGFAIGGVALSGDGRLMASSGSDGNRDLLEITQVRPDDLLAAACGKVQRNLTRTEWREYFGPDDVYRPTCPQKAAPDPGTK